jgi:hypothetical protein
MLSVWTEMEAMTVNVMMATLAMEQTVKTWMSVQSALSPAMLMPAALTLLVVMTVNADLVSLKMVQLA